VALLLGRGAAAIARSPALSPPFAGSSFFANWTENKSGVASEKQTTRARINAQHLVAENQLIKIIFCTVHK
jgi:hypothetical protein